MLLFCSYTVKDKKNCLTLVFIHYCVSFGHFKIKHFCPRVRRQDFFKLYRQDCGVKKINTVSIMYGFSDIPHVYFWTILKTVKKNF